LTGKQACAWVNSTQTCRDAKLVNGTIESCPVINSTVPYVPENFTTNDESTATYSIVGGIAGAVIIGGAVAGGVLSSQRRRNKDIFEGDVWSTKAQVNPLYNDRTQKFENPLYEARRGNDEDDGY